MTVADVATILRDLGGYGVAGLMFWFWQQERKERMRYRDVHDRLLKKILLQVENVSMMDSRRPTKE